MSQIDQETSPASMYTKNSATKPSQLLISVQNKMLSYRRETALQGAL